MDNLYWKDTAGRIYEFEASTNAGVYAWYRSMETDESVRLPVAQMTPMSDADAMAWARGVVA